MANDGRTEKPTAKRKREARRDGQIARSQELGTALSLLATLIALKAFLPRITHTYVERARGIWGHADDGLAQPGLASGFLKLFALGAAPFLFGALVIGVLGGLAQTRFAFSPKAARPKFSNLHPKRGLQRLKPSQAGWQLGKEVLKLGLFFAAIWGPVRSWIDTFREAKGLMPWVHDTGALVSTILIRALGCAVLIAAIDWLVNKRRMNKSLKMTKQQIKEEYKSSEGDPHIKGMRKRRAQELTRNRMLGEVARADVVIMNPTHYAVALKYTDGDVAPKVVAKGRDFLALKIRDLAHRNGVLVQVDPPLARALHRQCKVDQFVPAALYEAVAVLIATAFRRRMRGIA
jgi:flagellar biosynthetic protein FlhB